MNQALHQIQLDRCTRDLFSNLSSEYCSQFFWIQQVGILNCSLVFERPNFTKRFSITMTSRDISEETAQLSADLLDCDRNDYAKVNEIIDRIAELVPIHIKTSNNQYLYEDDFAGSNQKDLYNGSVTVHGLSQLQRTCTPWLVSLLNKPPRLPDMVKDSNELDVFTDRLSSIISLLCGRAGNGLKF